MKAGGEAVWEGAYNAVVRSHFASPRNAICHEPAPEVVFGVAGDEAAGVQFRLSARIERNRLSQVRFEAYGCPHSIAAASRLTEQLSGSDLASVRQWSWRELEAELEFPSEKRGRLLLLEDAVQALIQAAAVLIPNDHLMP